MIEDFVSRRQFAEDDINAPGDDSPPRPTMGAIDHFNQDQFGDVMAASPKPPAARHPNYVGAQTVHQYRTSPK